MPKMMALLLVECGPTDCRHLAVSSSRDKLIEKAMCDHLNCSMTPLQQNDTPVEIGDGLTLTIEEVEFV